MSTQVAVRLSDEIASFIDAEVAAGHAKSRAAVITRALEREKRYQTALSDVEVLERVQEVDDFDELAEYAARLPIDLD